LRGDSPPKVGEGLRLLQVLTDLQNAFPEEAPGLRWNGRCMVSYAISQRPVLRVPQSFQQWELCCTAFAFLRRLGKFDAIHLQPKRCSALWR
jgi:hypothetical protein